MGKTGMRRIGRIISAGDAGIMSKYIHQLPEWPKIEWKLENLSQQLVTVRHRQGRLFGHMQALGFPLRQEAILKTLTEDVIKSSE
ncbi:DUF4172 domain-containing protein, partial [Rhizobium sullae]